MKKLLYVLLFTPFFCAAQSEASIRILAKGVQESISETSFILKDQSVLFQKVYSSNLSKNELINKLKYFLPGVKNFQLTDGVNQTADQFSGRITDFIVNYQKFGTTDTGPGQLMAYGLNANVIVQVKDNKYRVIISNLVFKGIGNGLSGTISINSPFDDFICKDHRNKFRTGQWFLLTAKIIDADLATSFDITLNDTLSTDF